MSEGGEDVRGRSRTTYLALVVTGRAREMDRRYPDH